MDPACTRIMKRSWIRLSTLSAFLLFCVPSWAQSFSVSTQHNDNQRTGWDDQETILNTSNVNSSTFGYLYSFPVDDEVYAQPLVISGVRISGQAHNLLLIATVNNSLYAYDASDSAKLYWEKNFDEGGTPIKNTQIFSGYDDFDGNMGIVGTPVVDTSNQTIYFVSKDSAAGAFHQYLHKVDISTGLERSGSPVQVSASVSGTGVGNSGGVLSFNPLIENQRGGLLLLNGIVYIGWSSYGDADKYHGWLIGYDTASLSQKYVWCSTRNGSEGGIWMSGAGPAADSSGNIYLTIGNGSADTSNNTDISYDRGHSLVKLTPSGDSLKLSSFFTPYDFLFLNNGDHDFGVSQALLIPNTDMVMTGCKNDSIYVTLRDTMGGFNATSNQVIQQFKQSGTGQLHSSFAYYSGQSSPYVYVWSPEGGFLKQYPVDNSDDSLLASQVKTGPFGPSSNIGAFMAVSSDGSQDNTAILWAYYDAAGSPNTSDGTLQALKASDVTQSLWISSAKSSDNPGLDAKFSCPTIANGTVYLGTHSDKVDAYGLFAALPVSLLTFTATPMKDSYVLLQWSTTSEIGKDYFEVQRSQDGVHFQDIRKVYAHQGISAGIQDYLAIDNQPSLGTDYYRLRQVDLDGGSAYSRILRVSFRRKGLPYTFYPNPADQMIHFQLASGATYIRSIRVFDITGKLWLKQSYGSQTLGVDISIATLPRGEFFLQVITSQGAINKMFLKN